MTPTSPPPSVARRAAWVAANVGLLFIVVFALYVLISVREGSTARGPVYVADQALYGTVLRWGAMVLPTIVYLLLLLRLPAPWSHLHRRLAAVALSPLTMTIVYLSTGLSMSPDPVRMIAEGIALPVVYGLLVRLPVPAAIGQGR